MKLYVLLSLFSICTVVIGAVKSKAAVAIPKAKGKKSLKATFGFGILGKVIREAKSAFCSELESLTLQMTKPDNTAIVTTQMAMLITCINQDFEDPEFIASVVSKFSRKYTEDNVFTKLKSLISIHSIFQKVESDPQNTLMKCIEALRDEEDPKTKKLFFSSDIDTNIATNVAELEACAILKDYYPYLFQYINIRGDRSKTTATNVHNKIQEVVELLDYHDQVIETCNSATSTSETPLIKQCLDAIQTDVNWIHKHLQKLYSSKGAAESELDSEILVTLQSCGVTLSETHQNQLDPSSSTSSSNSNSNSSSGTKNNTKKSISSDSSGSSKKDSLSSSVPSPASASVASSKSAATTSTENIKITVSTTTTPKSIPTLIPHPPTTPPPSPTASASSSNSSNENKIETIPSSVSTTAEIAPKISSIAQDLESTTCISESKIDSSETKSTTKSSKKKSKSSNSTEVGSDKVKKEKKSKPSK